MVLPPSAPLLLRLLLCFLLPAILSTNALQAGKVADVLPWLK
jgi:hypothetical protein